MSRASGAARAIATCFGCGWAPVAPGTVGSAFGLALFALLLANVSVTAQIVAVIAATGIGVVSATLTSRHLGREDPSEIVIDELAGMWLALIGTSGWPAWVVAFLAFRLFDIVKPFPARAAERLPEGWGIMADDLIAGAYTLVIVHWLLPLVIPAG